MAKINEKLIINNKPKSLNELHRTYDDLMNERNILLDRYHELENEETKLYKDKTISEKERLKRIEKLASEYEKVALEMEQLKIEAEELQKSLEQGDTDESNLSLDDLLSADEEEAEDTTKEDIFVDEDEEDDFNVDNFKFTDCELDSVNESLDALNDFINYKMLQYSNNPTFEKIEADDKPMDLPSVVSILSNKKKTLVKQLSQYRDYLNSVHQKIGKNETFNELVTGYSLYVKFQKDYLDAKIDIERLQYLKSVGVNEKDIKRHDKAMNAVKDRIFDLEVSMNLLVYRFKELAGILNIKPFGED